MVESAVGLVIVEGAVHPNAMTTSFFSEVAHHPTALWVAISPKNYTHSLVQEAGRFSLVVLNERQKDIALKCGSVSGRETDKCGDLDTYKSSEGFIFLHGALASVGCSVRETIDLDDHTIFIADIIESHLDSRKAHLRHLLLSDLA